MRNHGAFFIPASSPEPNKKVGHAEPIGISNLRNTMRKIASGIVTGLLVAALLDIMILFTGLAQIVYEGRTGYWNPFWRAQAEFVVQHFIK